MVEVSDGILDGLDNVGHCDVQILVLVKKQRCETVYLPFGLRIRKLGNCGLGFGKLTMEACLQSLSSGTTDHSSCMHQTCRALIHIQSM